MWLLRLGQEKNALLSAFGAAVLYMHVANFFDELKIHTAMAVS